MHDTFRLTLYDDPINRLAISHSCGKQVKYVRILTEKTCHINSPTATLVSPGRSTNVKFTTGKYKKITRDIQSVMYKIVPNKRQLLTTEIQGVLNKMQAIRLTENWRQII